MNQPTLFPDDRYTPARKRDPETSQEGAASVEKCLTRLQEAMYLAIAAHPKTASEAARECQVVYGGCLETFRKRSGELKRAGRIRVKMLDGVPYTRACSVTGANAQVLEAVR